MYVDRMTHKNLNYTVAYVKWGPVFCLVFPFRFLFVIKCCQFYISKIITVLLSLLLFNGLFTLR